MGEDKNLCHYFIFVVKKIRTKIHITNTHNICFIVSFIYICVLFSGRL